jgi:hypothetical protein
LSLLFFLFLFFVSQGIIFAEFEERVSSGNKADNCEGQVTEHGQEVVTCVAAGDEGPDPA